MIIKIDGTTAGNLYKYDKLVRYEDDMISGVCEKQTCRLKILKGDLNYTSYVHDLIKRSIQ